MFASYKKALKVIDSCVNEYHLQGARRYINLFFESQSQFVGKNKYNFREYVTEEYVGDMYLRLAQRLSEKEVSLNL